MEAPEWRGAHTAPGDIVRCRRNPEHLASRQAFENVGDCPYCLCTPAERVRWAEHYRKYH